jgi:hypothetical protein
MNVEPEDTAASLSPADERRQRVRSLAIGWALAALALIFFAVTVVKLGGAG